MSAFRDKYKEMNREDLLTYIEHCEEFLEHNLADTDKDDRYSVYGRLQKYAKQKNNELADLRARVEKLEETGNKLVSLALSFNEDDPWIFERYDGVEIVSNAQNTLRGEA